jgi:hypothetical protein
MKPVIAQSTQSNLQWSMAGEAVASNHSPIFGKQPDVNDSMFHDTY